MWTQFLCVSYTECHSIDNSRSETNDRMSTGPLHVWHSHMMTLRKQKMKVSNPKALFSKPSLDLCFKLQERIRSKNQFQNLHQRSVTCLTHVELFCSSQHVFDGSSPQSSPLEHSIQVPSPGIVSFQQEGESSCRVSGLRNSGPPLPYSLHQSMPPFYLPSPPC